MKIYGHRGASDQYPENTMLAFQKAIEKGADGIETDVHLTKDNICVLIHDETIDRTSNGTGWIRDFTYEELLKFDFKNNKDIEEDWIKIPTLEQLLVLAKENKIELNLELKTDCIAYEGIEKCVLDLVKKYDMLDYVIFSSFNIETLVNVKKIEPKAKTGYLFERNFEDQVIKAHHYHLDYIHPRYSMLNDRVIRNCKKYNLAIHVWTVNDKESMQLMKEYGVDICITNKVSLARSVIDRRKHEIR